MVDKKHIDNYVNQMGEPTVSNPVEAVVMCKCQDSDGNVCGREMTNQEQDQDGMCWHCADSVWNEITSNDTVKWKHSDRVDGNYT